MSSDDKPEDNKSSTEKRADKNLISGSAIIDSETIDCSELTAMKGDTVGDTVYSGKWIINTLISLSKVHETGWTYQLESDLYMLWDMTVEKDIVTYLAENEFLKLSEFTLKTTTEPTLREIILGIIANMCCQPTMLSKIGNNEDLVSTVLDLLTSDDTDTLIQTLRLLQAATRDIQRDPKSVWRDNLKDCDFLGHNLTYILQYSTNEDVLVATTDVVYSISEVEDPKGVSFLEELFQIDNLVPALLECFLQVVRKDDDTNHSQTHLKVIDNWLAIMLCIMENEQLKFEDIETDESFIKITKILQQILRPYQESCNLFPMEETIAWCIRGSVEMAVWFQRNQISLAPSINSSVATIIFRLMSDVKEVSNESESDITSELLKYLGKYWIEILEYYSKEELSRILNLCEKPVVENLTIFVRSYPKVPTEKLEKLIKATCDVEGLFV